MRSQEEIKELMKKKDGWKELTYDEANHPEGGIDPFSYITEDERKLLRRKFEAPEIIEAHYISDSGIDFKTMVDEWTIKDIEKEMKDIPFETQDEALDWFMRAIATRFSCYTAVNVKEKPDYWIVGRLIAFKIIKG